MTKIQLMIFLISFSCVAFPQSSNNDKCSFKKRIDINGLNALLILNAKYCSIHSEIDNKKSEKCQICNENLVKENKIKVLSIDENLDLSKVKGKTLIRFNDGTQVLKRLKIEDSTLSVRLSEHGFQHCIGIVLTILHKGMRYKYTFGEEVGNHGHHH